MNWSGLVAAADPVVDADSFGLVAGIAAGCFGLVDCIAVGWIEFVHHLSKIEPWRPMRKKHHQIVPVVVGNHRCHLGTVDYCNLDYFGYRFDRIGYSPVDYCWSSDYYWNA